MGQIRFRKELVYTSFDGEYLWQLRPVRYSTLGRAETIKLAAQDSGITESQLEQAFDAFAHEIEQLLCNGHSLEFGELGIMQLNIKAKAVRMPENVSTDLIKYAHIVLRPSKSFKEEMKRIKHIIDPAPDVYITKSCPFDIAANKSDKEAGLEHVRIVKGGGWADEPFTQQELEELQLNGNQDATVTATDNGYDVRFTNDLAPVVFHWNEGDNYLTLKSRTRSDYAYIVNGVGGLKYDPNA